MLHFLKKLENALWTFSKDAYSVFTFQPLYKLHSGISKPLRICFMTYIGLANLCTEGSSFLEGVKRLKLVKGK